MLILISIVYYTIQYWDLNSYNIYLFDHSIWLVVCVCQYRFHFEKCVCSSRRSLTKLNNPRELNFVVVERFQVSFFGEKDTMAKNHFHFIVSILEMLCHFDNMSRFLLYHPLLMQICVISVDHVACFLCHKGVILVHNYETMR